VRCAATRRGCKPQGFTQRPRSPIDWKYCNKSGDANKEIRGTAGYILKHRPQGSYLYFFTKLR
jgi:hypothetical protein